MGKRLEKQEGFMGFVKRSSTDRQYGADDPWRNVSRTGDSSGIVGPRTGAERF